MMIDFNINFSIKDFCKEVLISRFPGEILRQQISESSSDKLNFCCPFCGDSKTDPTKKRGNLYLTTETYKCYNDGCEVHMPLDRFIARLSIKYGISIPNVQKEISFSAKASPLKRGFLLEFLIHHESRKKLLNLSEIAERFRLMKCSDAPNGSRIREYVDSRLLTDLPLFNKTCYYDSLQNKIYIFNVDLKSDKIIGFSMRYLNPPPGGIKYNIKNYSEFEKTGLVKEMAPEFIEKINLLNNYFNILNIDFSKDITATEGQFDSLFIDNCVATTGVTKSKKTLDELTQKGKTRILFDNDEAGLKHSIEFLEKGYRVFMWSLVIQCLKKNYPSSIREIRKIKDINDLFIFLKNHDSLMNYTRFNSFINEYFTNSHFDMFLL